MGKLKIVGIVLSAISTLVNAAKSIIKFFEYIGKLKRQPANCAV